MWHRQLFTASLVSRESFLDLITKLEFNQIAYSHCRNADTVRNGQCGILCTPNFIQGLFYVVFQVGQSSLLLKV